MFFMQFRILSPFAESAFFPHLRNPLPLFRSAFRIPVPRFIQPALCSLNGIEYAKVINGATNTVEFLQFFGECGQSLNATTGWPCLAMGDIIVMDNLSCHHCEALEEWLGEMGIELIYTPTYSPDFKPIEESFSKIKSVLTNDIVRGNIDNLNLTVVNATMQVTNQDMHGYYRHTGYFSLQ